MTSCTTTIPSTALGTSLVVISTSQAGSLCYVKCYISEILLDIQQTLLYNMYLTNRIGYRMQYTGNRRQRTEDREQNTADATRETE